MASVRVLTGGPRSDRAARVDALITQHISDALLIVPTNAYANRRAAGLLAQLGRGALLAPPVITFGELVDRILRGAGVDARDVSPLEQRILLARAVAEVRAKGALDALGAAADSEGFIDHLLSVIYELKQAAIEPKQFRRYVRGRNAPMDGVVAEVYSVYQDHLKRADMVDLPGKYWLARIECERAEHPRGLTGIRRFVFDDFDDFTPSEFGVIRALGKHADDLAFGINLNPDPEQRSLYAAPRQTIEKIRDTFESVTFDDARPEPPARRRSEFIGATMLIRKEVPAPVTLENDVEFAECHTLEHEIETIARRIKHLIRHEGAAPSRIAVVWRGLAPVAAPMREIFSEFGIPFAGLETRSLSESAAAGFVLRFLEAAQSWSADAVLDVLTAPWFVGPGALHADRFPILVRAARISGYESGWRSGVQRIGRFVSDPGQIELKKLVDHVPDAVAACGALSAQVDRFAAQAKTLAGKVAVRSRIEVLQRLMSEWKVQETIAELPEGAERDFEAAAVAGMTRTLAVLAHGYANDPERVDVGTFSRLLRRAFATAEVRGASGRGVACLDFQHARYLSFDYVFLAGMTDAQVPARRRLSAIYSDDDRRELADAQVPLDRAEAHNQGEILLFQRMFAIAGRRVFASWHRLNSGGTAVGRSLYLNEIADRLGGLDESAPRAPADMLVPPPELAGCRRDAQNIAVPAKADVHFAELIGAAGIEERRYGFDAFDAHDGALTAKDSLDAIGAQYDAVHEFSASQLEKYAECPFQFFQERVLKLFAIERPEQAFDHLARGSVVHAALEAFHRNYLGRALGEIPEDEATNAMTDAAGAAFDEAARHLRNLSPGLLAAERARTLATLQRHLRLMRGAEDSEPWRPIHLERAFGGKFETPAFALDLGSESIRVAGRIDRIDESNGRHRLVDYKTSKVPPKKIKTGKAFQLALYALACEAALIPDCTVDCASYIAVGKDKGTTIALTRSGKTPNWDERIDVARNAVLRAVEGIRAGRFYPTRDGERCRGCPDEKVCRFERARLQRKPAS